MRDLNTFLAEQETSLLHKEVPESGIKKDKKGDSSFDESKVKRDGDGMFAKKAGGSDSSGDKNDADWMKSENLNATLNKITKDVGPAFGEVVGTVLQKFGLKSRADLAKNPEARAEAVKAAVQVLNNYAENRGVSPSGNSKIQYRVGNHGKIIAGVVTDGKYTVIPKKADSSLRLDASAPPLPKAKPTVATTPGTRPTSPTVDRPAVKPTMQRPSASAAVTKKPNPFRNTAALERRAEQQVAVAGTVDDTLQKFLDKVGKKKKLRHDDSFSDSVEHALPKEDQAQGPDAKWLFKDNIKALKQRAANAAIRPGIIAEVNRLTKKYKIPQSKILDTPAAFDELANWYLTVLNAWVATNGLSPTGIYRLVFKRSSKNIYGCIEGGDANKRFTLPEEPVLAHGDPVDAFLEHHGIKGMRWGIRRTDDQLGRVASLKAKFSRKKPGDDEEAKGKSSGGDSKPESSGLKSGGGSDHVAVDHERLVDSLGKSVNEMSTQEIQQATNRAQAIQNYQRLFSPENSTAKSPLEQQVARMNLEKQRRDLDAQLNPPQKSALAKLAERSQQGFTAYQAIDKAVGGDLSKALSRKLGINPPPNQLDQAKLRTELAKAHKAEADARDAFAKSAKNVQANDIIRIEEHALKGVLLSNHVDAVSKAPNYPIVGKRSANGPIPGAGGGTHKFGAPSKSIDTNQWETRGYKITNGVFHTNPSYKPAAKIPSLNDLVSKLNDTTPYVPTHKTTKAPSLLDIYRADDKARKGTPDLLTQLRRGRHRK